MLYSLREAVQEAAQIDALVLQFFSFKKKKQTAVSAPGEVLSEGPDYSSFAKATAHLSI